MKSIFTFCVLAACVLPLAARNDAFPSPSVVIEEDPSPSYVRGYVASEDGSFRLSPVTADFEEGTPSGAINGTITLNEGTRFQHIDGFGFAITGSTAFNLLKMTSEDRKVLLNKIFSPTAGYGCNYVRIPIGCSDFSLREYTCCDTPGIENFALTDEETKYIIPVMKEILDINPGVKVISAPWTAPRWMKTNGQWTGGNLKPECYQDYATYFVKWIKAFESNGVKIYGVTPQNEPLNRGNSASMFMGWEEQRDFVKNALGPAFRHNSISTKIYVFDHNYNYDNLSDQQSYPTKIYADPVASQYIAGAAFHNYGGNASEMTRVHNAYPDKELIFTEWTAGTWSWDGVGMEAITSDAKSLLFDVLENWGQGSIVWNLLLDSDRGPNRPGGSTTANGAIDISKSDYRTLTYNSFYYVICAAASAMPEDAVRIDLSGYASNVSALAFAGNDDFGLLLLNTSPAERKVRVKEGSRSFIAVIPPKSIAAYKWK